MGCGGGLILFVFSHGKSFSNVYAFFIGAVNMHVYGLHGYNSCVCACVCVFISYIYTSMFVSIYLYINTQAYSSTENKSKRHFFGQNFSLNIVLGMPNTICQLKFKRTYVNSVKELTTIY